VRLQHFKTWLRGGNAKTEILPSEEYRYVIYAREFGWTPAQVDELPLTVEPWLLPIHNAINEFVSERELKAIEEAQKRNRRG
jgi:hypothetical protein